MGCRRFSICLNAAEIILNQAVGVNVPARFLAGFLEKILPVHIVNEDVLTTITAIHDVIDGAGVFDSQLAQHGVINGTSGIPSSQKKNLVMV